MNITHPLTVDQQIEATRKRCACVGGGERQITGKILKVIPSATGFWYYIDTGLTVSELQVTGVLPVNK